VLYTQTIEDTRAQSNKGLGQMIQQFTAFTEFQNDYSITQFAFLFAKEYFQTIKGSK
jgi:hypothetical protein